MIIKKLCLIYLLALFKQANSQTLPDSISLTHVRFFKHKAWHDTIFPEKRIASSPSLRNAVNHAIRVKDLELSAYAEISLAKSLLYERKYGEAFDYLNRSLMLENQLEALSPTKQYLYREACSFYNDFGTYKMAAHYMKKCIDISLQRDSIPTARLYGFYTNYARLCYRNRDYDSSYYYYNLAIETGKKVSPIWWASGLNNYGMILFSGGRQDSALKLFLKAREIAEGFTKADTSFIHSINDNIAEVYAKQQKYGEALRIFNKKFKYYFNRRVWLQAFNAGLRSGMMMIKTGDLAGAGRRIHTLDSLLLINRNRMGRDKTEGFIALKAEMAIKKGAIDEYVRQHQLLLESKESAITDLGEDRFGKLESMLLENIAQFNKQIEIEKLKLAESKARARFNMALAIGSVIAGALLIAIIVVLYRRRIALSAFTIEQETYKRKLAESNFENELLSRQRLKQQLELNRVLVEQESYKRELAEMNLKNEQLEKTQISQQLELKKRDVTDYALAYSQRKKILDEVLAKLKDIRKSGQPIEQLQELSKTLKKQLQNNTSLEIEPGRIEQVNHAFFEKLKDIGAELTPGEKDLTGLIRLGFSSKDISAFRGISPASVRISKFRLKKKLGLAPDKNLAEFIKAL